MATGNILREFLVAIGFAVDEQEYRNLEGRLKNTNERLAELGKGAAVAAAAISAAFLKTANDMQQLFFASRGADTTVNALMGLRFAADQIGIGADKAAGLVQNLASSIRSNPALGIWFKQLGLTQVSDNVQNLNNLINRLAQLSAQGPLQHALAARIAEQFGIDEQTLHMLERFLPQYIQYQKVLADKAALGGVNPDQQAAQFNQFMQDVGTLWATIKLIGISGFAELIPFAERLVHLLQTGADFLLAMNKSTHGLSSAFASIVATLATAFGGFAALKGLLGFIGLGGGSAAAEAGGAAAAGGAGLLSAPVIIGIVAVVAAIALAWLGWHYRDKLESGAKSASSSLGDLIKRFEGKSLQVYKDITGKPTVGFGHLVKPGEDFSGGISNQQALELLGKDTSEAAAAVRSMVTRSLNQNQLDALTDFVFNVGPEKFKNSTLLKDVNAGDFAGADNEFAKWNKARVNGVLVPNAGLSARREQERELFDKPVTIQQETNITIHGSGDAKEAGKAVADEQTTVNGNLLRDMQGAVK